MMIPLLFTIISSALPAAVVTNSQCQPPNDCSVHVFRVRLSQKPEDEAQNETFNTNHDRDNNYYEIRGGKEMTPKLAAEIISSMGENADPRLKEKINKQEFYWKAVSPNERVLVPPTVQVPPPPPPPPKRIITTTEASYSFRPSDFPVLLISFLICIGIIVGVMLTAMCLFWFNMQKEPQFDRSSVVIYNKVGGANNRRPMLSTRREQQIELIENASVAPSMSSATRIGPAWRNGNNPPQPSTASRHISL